MVRNILCADLKWQLIKQIVRFVHTVHSIGLLKYVTFYAVPLQNREQFTSVPCNMLQACEPLCMFPW